MKVKLNIVFFPNVKQLHYLIMVLFHDIEASQEPFFSAVDLMGDFFSKLMTEKFFNWPKVPKDVCQGSLGWSIYVLVFSS